MNNKQAAAYAVLALRRGQYAKIEGNLVNDPDEQEFVSDMESLMDELTEAEAEKAVGSWRGCKKGKRKVTTNVSH